MYYQTEVARINAEMVRPFIGHAGGKTWGGYTYERFVVAGLARHIQTRQYLHECSYSYCLKNRSSCRFFYPWPEQPQQQYDENTERVALCRRLPADERLGA